MRVRVRVTYLLSLLICLSTLATAQSTSPWIRVGDSTFGDPTPPNPGAAYMTVYVRAATVYQNSNWWTNFIEKNRQAVLTINLAGNVAGVAITQTRAGNPIEMRKNKSMVDLGYSGIVVDHLPTTFSNMTLDLQINKTAQDGLQPLMNAVSQLSSAQPPVLSVSAQAMGMANFAKSVADFLFNTHLLEKKMSTQSPLPSNGLLPAGIYASFAGDSQADYQQYLAPATPGLRWTGTQLTYANVPVNGITYFVVEVGYHYRFFRAPLDALSFGGVRPWVSLILLADREIPNINDGPSAKRISNDVQSHLSDARTLLDADPDFIQGEKDDIATAVYARLNNAYRARLLAIADTLPVPASGGVTPTEGVPRHDLLMFNPSVESVQFLQKVQKTNKSLAPTAGQ